MSIKEIKVHIDNEDDFKSLYVCALMMMSDDTEEGMLYVHSECLALREQMQGFNDTDVPLGRLH